MEGARKRLRKEPAILACDHTAGWFTSSHGGFGDCGWRTDFTSVPGRLPQRPQFGTEPSLLIGSEDAAQAVIVEGTVEVRIPESCAIFSALTKRSTKYDVSRWGNLFIVCSTHRVWIVGKKVHRNRHPLGICMSQDVHVFATCAIGPAVELLRQKGYGKGLTFILIPTHRPNL